MRKLCLGIGVLLVAFMLSFPASQAVSAEETAEDLSGDASFVLNGTEINPVPLSDGKNSTKITVEEGDRLTVKATRQFARLYLSFDRPPEPYSIVINGEEVKCGSWGFLHELVELPSPAREAEIILPAGILCGVTPYSEGGLPADVQQWEPPYAYLETGEAYQGCDMLVLPTHADDDQLWFGPAIATYVDQGKTIQVAYLTNHWGEPYRPHELLNGLWKSGIRAYPIIPDFPDYYSESLEHAKTLYDVDAMEEYMVTLLRRFRPSVVVGHALNGEYGHGVHMLNAWLVARTVEGSGDSAFHPDSAEKYGVYDVPKTYLHLYEENSIALDIETPLDSFGGKTAFEVAEEGYACHVSQQQYWFKVFKSGPYDARKFGLYRTTVGLDTGNDMFEHIESRLAPASSEEASSEWTEPASSSGSDAIPSEPESAPETAEGEGNGALMVLALICAGLGAAVIVIRIFVIVRRKKGRGVK